MADIDFTAPKTETAASTTERKPAYLWLNVGADVTITDESGKEVTQFISTPVGIPLDTMAPMKGRSQLAMLKNALLEKLQKAALSLEPGTSDYVNGLRLQITRASSEAPQANDSQQAAIDQIKVNFG